jgi:hypothetical protein
MYSEVLLESGPSTEHFTRKSVTALIVDNGVGAIAPLFIYAVFLVTGKSFLIRESSIWLICYILLSTWIFPSGVTRHPSYFRVKYADI